MAHGAPEHLTFGYRPRMKVPGGETETASPARSGGLDAVRAIACAMVVSCHVSLYAGHGELVGLKNGVMLFFALSGYLLYRPFVTGSVDLGKYGIARTARILPAYVVALVGLTLITGDRSFSDQPLTYLLFLQNYDPALWQGFIGVSWSLVLEILFYLTLPLIAWAGARRPTRLLTLAAASFVGGLLAIVAAEALDLSPDRRMVTTLYPFMVWAFAPGMLVALWTDRSELRSPMALAAGVVLLIVGTTAPWASIDLPSAIGAFLVLGWVVTAAPDLGRMNLLASASAAISYSVYLWHGDLLATFDAVPALALTVVVAGLIYWVVERPIIGFFRALIGVRRKASPPVGSAKVGAGLLTAPGGSLL
jgi:peptidoglycan/LPS O-acetylase OafA/YrhL